MSNVLAEGAVVAMVVVAYRGTSVKNRSFEVKICSLGAKRHI